MRHHVIWVVAYRDKSALPALDAGSEATCQEVPGRNYDTFTLEQYINIHVFYLLGVIRRETPMQYIHADM